MYTFNTHTRLGKFQGQITGVEKGITELGPTLHITTDDPEYPEILAYLHELPGFDIVAYIEQTLGLKGRFIGGDYDNMYDFIAHRKYTRLSYIQNMIKLLLPLVEQVELDPEISVEYETMRIRFPVTILRELVQK